MKKKKTPSPAAASAAVLPSPLPATSAEAALFRRRTWQIGLLLAAVTFLVYLRAVFNDWTNFDDNVYVTENPTTLKGLTWDNFLWATTGWHAAFWQPLVWLSYQLEVSLFGTDPHVYHLTNVLWHTLDTVLLFVLARTLTGTLWRSAFVAALFALHPLHVESVAWITERKDVLSAGFFFATLIAYVHYVRAPKGRRLKPYCAALGLYLLGLMAKPMLVTMPFVMLLLDFWPLCRLGLADWAKATCAVATVPISLPFVYASAKATPATREFRRAVAEKIPFFILTVAGAVVAIYAVADYNDLRPLSAYPIPVRIWNSIETYCAYMGNMVWPSGLIAFYLYPTHFNYVAVALEAVLLLGLTGAALWQAKARPWLLFGWLWFLGTLLPVIG
ncbi:MAG TPA: hypothetical protein VIM58_07155, partial [Candidatus Methylacidiphilales bacterium]